MARTYARVKTDIWADDDFRALPVEAQHLYFVLLTSNSLNYCGVTDWRPVRIAAASGSWSADAVTVAGQILAAHRYVVIDEATEEVLIRSFVRNDGFMAQATVAAAMVRAYGHVASSQLRGVVVHELNRLYEDHPEFKGWSSGKDLLGNPSIDPFEGVAGDPVCDPISHPFCHPGSDPSTDTALTLLVTPSLPTPSPSPSPTPSSVPRVPRNNGKATRIPEPWVVDEPMKEWALERGMQPQWVLRQTERFTNYWLAKPGKEGTKTDWRATWRNWLLKAQDDSPAAASPVSRNGYAKDDVRGRFK